MSASCAANSTATAFAGRIRRPCAENKRRSTPTAWAAASRGGLETPDPPVVDAFFPSDPVLGKGNGQDRRAELVNGCAVSPVNRSSLIPTAPSSSGIQRGDAEKALNELRGGMRGTRKAGPVRSWSGTDAHAVQTGRTMSRREKPDGDYYPGMKYSHSNPKRKRGEPRLRFGLRLIYFHAGVILIGRCCLGRKDRRSAWTGLMEAGGPVGQECRVHRVFSRRNDQGRSKLAQAVLRPFSLPPFSQNPVFSPVALTWRASTPCDAPTSHST